MTLVNKKILVLYFLFLFFSYSCNSSDSKTIISGKTMGTTYSITLIGSAIDESVVKVTVDSLLNNISNQFSTYLINSEINKVNQSTSKKIHVSDSFIYVLEKAFYYCDISNGLYDITVSPLVDIWGFSDNIINSFPSEQLIQRIKNEVGYKNLSIKGNNIVKQNRKLQLDLNSIAKGYGVDIIYDYLDDQNILNYIIEIGGEVRTRSNGKKKWIIGVQHPQKNDIIKKIKLKNLSMATSGTYNNFFNKNGIEYSHLINPLTGYPVKHKILSATVIADKCIDADALATMLMVIDTKKGINIVNELDRVECLLMLKNHTEGISLIYSDGFENFIVD